MANTLPARARVKKRREIDQIYRKGKRVSGPLFRIHVRPNELGHARLAVGVPKRTGNAVKRNRWKRMLRESFRLNRDRLAAVDILIIPHGGPEKLKRQEVEKEVMKLLRKLRGVVQ